MDLPEPDGPMIAASWPLGKPVVMPRRAWTAVSPSPYTRRSSVVLTIGRDVVSLMAHRMVNQPGPEGVEGSLPRVRLAALTQA